MPQMPFLCQPVLIVTVIPGVEVGSDLGGQVGTGHIRLTQNHTNTARVLVSPPASSLRLPPRLGGKEKQLMFIYCWV